MRPSRADAKTDAGKEFRPGKLVLESEPLCHGKRPPRSAKQPLAGPVEPQPATVKYQEAVESDHDGLVQISRRTAAIEVRTYRVGRCIRRRFAGIRVLSGKQDEKSTSIRMRECRRMRDEGRA